MHGPHCNAAESLEYVINNCPEDRLTSEICVQCNFTLHIETTMIIKHAIAIAALALATGGANAWTLVYANDAAGNVTAGSLQSLRTAVLNGSSVRVVSDVPGKHAWSVPCFQMAVKYDAQGVVCFGGSPLASDNSMGAQFSNVYSPPQIVHIMLNTQGQYSQALVRISDGVLASKTLVYHPMQWFVQ